MRAARVAHARAPDPVDEPEPGVRSPESTVGERGGLKRVGDLQCPTAAPRACRTDGSLWQLWDPNRPNIEKLHLLGVDTRQVQGVCRYASSSLTSCSKNRPASVTTPIVCQRTAVGELGHDRRVDVHAYRRDARRQHVPGRDRMQHRREHQARPGLAARTTASRAGRPWRR